MGKNNEELKRFKLLLEYDFYIGEEDNIDPLRDNPDSEILTEEPPEIDGEGDDEEIPSGEEFSDDDNNTSDDEGGFGDEPTEDLPEPEPMEDLPEPEPMEDLPEPEPMEDEVELDVTELVQGTEEAKQASDRASQQINVLMNKFDTLSQSLNKMSMINQKIDDLESEIEKRNPLPSEKLEMQSLNSFPYSLKLTDYWSEKEGNYDMMGGEVKDKEYVLTQDEVDRDYNPIEIKDSFTKPEEDENDFTY